MPNYAFQKRIIDQTVNALRHGYHPVIQSPPGSGKSRMGIEIARTLKVNALWIAPTREITNQMIALTKHEPNIRADTNVGVICHAKLYANTELLIFDEAHHTVAETYTTIQKMFPNAMIMGLTGTLSRYDGQGFEDVFDQVIYGPDVDTLIGDHVLSPYTLYTPNISVPLFSKAKLNINAHGEYSSHVLDQAIDVKRAYAEVYKAYKKYANGKRMILYAPSIMYAQKFAKYFNSRNVSSDAIFGTQKQSDRDLAIENFRNGRTKILCNCNIISEGFNVPDCDGCILVRPTRSLTLYLQQAMRPMRYVPNKTAIIIDHTLNAQTFGTPSNKHVWRLEGEQSIQKKAATREKFIDGYLKRRFDIDVTKQLKTLKKTNQRLAIKDRIVDQIEHAIDIDSFAELLSTQMQYKIKPTHHMAWAYWTAKTYNITLPPALPKP